MSEIGLGDGYLIYNPWRPQLGDSPLKQAITTQFYKFYNGEN